MAVGWLAVCGLAAAAPGWDIRKVDGEDYVSLENIKRFYSFQKLTRSGSRITIQHAKVVMNLTVGSPECTMNRVKFVLSRPVTDIGGQPFVSRTDLAKLIDPVLRPSFIKNAGNFTTVVIDAGHGGKDPGALSAYGNEAEYTLKTAQLLRTELMKRNYRVVMTRNSDQYLSLQERVNAANAVPGDAIFVSIHFNSGNSAAHGIETFTLSPPGVAHYGRGLVAADAMLRAGNQHDSANVALATAVHGMVVRGLGNATFDRGIKRARYTVLSGVRHPAILLEGGFMSHAFESRLINKPEYQATLAKAVAAAVDKYRRAVTAKVTASPPG